MIEEKLIDVRRVDFNYLLCYWGFELSRGL